jgi:hypothetical protein
MSRIGAAPNGGDAAIIGSVMKLLIAALAVGNIYIYIYILDRLALVPMQYGALPRKAAEWKVSTKRGMRHKGFLTKDFEFK